MVARRNDQMIAQANGAELKSILYQLLSPCLSFQCTAQNHSLSRMDLLSMSRIWKPLSPPSLACHFTGPVDVETILVVIEAKSPM